MLGQRRRRVIANTSKSAIAGALLAAVTTLPGCGEWATLRGEATMGPSPRLVDPVPAIIPTVHIAPAKGWSRGATPDAAPGLAVKAFASGLDHPRWLYVLPNGDILVAETNAPPKPDDGKGLRGLVMRWFMSRAGATVPSANRITLLRDMDGDGVADMRTVFLQGLNSPFGMVLVGGDLYVACTDAILRFPYVAGATSIPASGETVVDLPAGTINHHWTKNVIASRDGSRLYVTVGSNSNVAENGMENEANRAAILEVDPATRRSRVFASGLRNPNGLAFNPRTGALWTVVNERDEIGSDLVPDYLTSVREGGFYGWPYSYYGTHVDTRVTPARPDLVATAIVPDYALGSHVAPLGMTFYDGGLLGPRFVGGVFVGEHGSWNRRPRSGYKVVFVPFVEGRPSGLPEDVLTGFVDDDGDARGRPVGVAIDRAGALLVADDVGNVIWRVTALSGVSASANPGPALPSN
ncbi:MAG: sorbosone dehydrogenase family protein [Casimicrobiaceae bacterium]